MDPFSVTGKVISWKEMLLDTPKSSSTGFPADFSALVHRLYYNHHAALAFCQSNNTFLAVNFGFKKDTDIISAWYYDKFYLVRRWTRLSFDNDRHR